VNQETFSIIAATLYGNRGAEAMLETVVGRLRTERPGLRFHLFSYYPAADRHLLVDDAGMVVRSSTPLALAAWLVPWALVFGVLRKVFGRGVFRFAPADIRALAESEALVDLAGVAFIDGREKFLPFNTLTLLPAWLLGTPVVKMPQAVGPFEKPINRALARHVLPMCRMLWARGARTRQHLEASGFPGLRFAQGDDIAFNHRDAYNLTRDGGEALDARFVSLDAARPVEGGGLIGVCPSAVLAVQSRKAGGNYEQALSALVGDLLRSGHVVVLFPNATRDAAGDAERNNDLPVIRRIRDSAGSNTRLLAFDVDMNAVQIKRVIRAMDAVLVSRFHAMVGALSLQVPAAVLGWSHKYAEVMARFGLEDNVMDYKALSAPELHARVARVFEERARMRAAIAAGLPEVKASADRPVAALLTPSLGADLA
jgi:polysaccharide pyruvyl transferase WcaK-like protein